jgi:hypothetical protein
MKLRLEVFPFFKYSVLAWETCHGDLFSFESVRWFEA